jgi:hypothetical protein
MGKTTRVSTTRDRAPRRPNAEQRAAKEHAEAQLDAFLRQVTGHEPEIEDGLRHLQFGTAEGAAFVVPDADGDMMFTVFSEVMVVPSDPELAVGLLRQAHQINFMADGVGRLAVTDNTLVATASELASRMGDSEFGRAVHSVMALSDAVGPELRRLFDKTTRKRAKAGRSRRERTSR